MIIPSNPMFDKKGKPVSGFMHIVNTPEYRMGEAASWNVHATADGMAKLGAYMVNGGSLNGRRLLSQETIDEFHSNPVTETEIPLGLRTSFTRGGVNRWGKQYAESVERNPGANIEGISEIVEERAHRNRDGWYGWMGLGGSIF